MHTAHIGVDLVPQVVSHLSCLPSSNEEHVKLLEDASHRVCEGTLTGLTKTLLQNLSLDVSADTNTLEMRLWLNIRFAKQDLLLLENPSSLDSNLAVKES
jgi:hypothetical protein